MKSALRLSSWPSEDASAFKLPWYSIIVNYSADPANDGTLTINSGAAGDLIPGRAKIIRSFGTLKKGQP
jgi:hypothetical protein